MTTYYHAVHHSSWLFVKNAATSTCRRSDELPGRGARRPTATRSTRWTSWWDAFEEIAQEVRRGEDRAARRTDSPAGWRRSTPRSYPDRVSGMILINPYASSNDVPSASGSTRRCAAATRTTSSGPRSRSKEIKPKTAARVRGQYDWFRCSDDAMREPRRTSRSACCVTIWRDPSGDQHHDSAVRHPRRRTPSRTPVLMFFPRQEQQADRLRRHQPAQAVLPEATSP